LLRVGTKRFSGCADSHELDEIAPSHGCQGSPERKTVDRTDLIG
jgi:hypothetical protein